MSYSNTKIRFYWLVANDATAKEGELQFEIMASGAVNVPNTSTTKSYLWRTRPNGRLNVLKSLTGKQMVDPEWQRLVYPVPGNNESESWRSTGCRIRC